MKNKNGLKVVLAITLVFVIASCDKNKIQEPYNLGGAIIAEGESNYMIFVTQKSIGDTVAIAVFTEEPDGGNMWMDKNNNGKKDVGEGKDNAEMLDEGIFFWADTVSSKTFTIYGKITGISLAHGADIEEMDVSKMGPLLQILDASSNPLKALDLSYNQALLQLDISGNPNLTYLDLSNNKELELFICHDNPDIDIQKLVESMTDRSNKDKSGTYSIKKNTLTGEEGITEAQKTILNNKN